MITPNLTLNIWSFGSNIFVVSRQKHSVKVCRSQIASASCNFTSLFLVVGFFFFSSVKWKKNNTYFSDMSED